MDSLSRTGAAHKAADDAVYQQFAELCLRAVEIRRKRASSMDWTLRNAIESLRVLEKNTPEHKQAKRIIRALASYTRLYKRHGFPLVSSEHREPNLNALRRLAALEKARAGK